MISRREREAKKAAMNFFIQASATSFAIAPAITVSGINLPQGNVLGVGVGARTNNGAALSGEEVVRVYVTSAAAQPSIPQSFGDLPSQVVEVGDVTASALLSTGQRFSRHRPASCGISVGHPKVTAGTLGCRVTKDGKRYILSNNHVLANCNSASRGDAIIQPGTLDGGQLPADRIARLDDFLALDFSPGGANDFDAAIAELDKASDVESEIIDIGAPGAAPVPAALYQSVRKHGRTTGHSVGVVVDTSVSIWINYGLQRAWFQDQIAVQGVGASHFSSGGDSGSLIVDAVTLAPVALLFAGSSSGMTFGNPIDPVLNHFGVRMD